MAAHAEKPAEPVAALVVDVSGWSVVDYNNAIIEEGLVALRQVDDAVSRGMFTPSPTAMEDIRQDCLRVLTERRDSLARLPPWEGDAGLRDAAVVAFDGALATLDAEVKSLYELLGKEDIRNADVERVEQLFKSLEERSAAIDAQLKTDQEGFAERHGVQVVDSAAAPDRKPLANFEAQGIPPEGRTLSSNVFMNLTVSYTNGVMFRANRIVEAVGLCFTIDPNVDAQLLVDESRRSQMRIEKVQGELQAMDANWQGESSLMDGALALATAGLKVTGMLETWGGLWLKKTRTKEEVDRINEVGGQLNGEMDVGTRAFQQGEAAWRQRWHIDDYNAFVLSHQQ